MLEIVIPDLSHSLCLEQFRKTLCDVVGLDQIANLIDTYILKIFLDVAASAQAAVFLLLFFQGEKSFPHEKNKRQCSHTIEASALCSFIPFFLAWQHQHKPCLPNHTSHSNEQGCIVSDPRYFELKKIRQMDLKANANRNHRWRASDNLEM